MTAYWINGGAGLLAILASTVPCWADKPTGNFLEVSCQWSDPPVAKAAAALLRVGDTVQLYCKTCGDRMSTPVTITRSEVLATPVEGSKQVNMNGGMLDLALAYIRTKPNGPWTNLAGFTKCGTPTSNPNTLPVSLVSKATPGPLPGWWQDVQNSVK